MSKYICHILLILLMCALSACSHEDSPVTSPDDVMIEFGIADEFVAESKVSIDNTNCQQFGFVAFGAWNMGSWENDDIFGQNGTEVKYTIGWDYSPKRYWQAGTYDFAGVMPSSLFAATYPHSSTTQSGSAAASLDNDTHNTLTLDFGSAGYNLAAGQHDIMIAFDNDIDNSNRIMGTEVNGKVQQVNFAFEHQLSLVIIKAASLEPRTDIRIDEIKVYGNHTSTVGDMVITNNRGTYNAEYEITGNTDKTNVYKTITRPTGNDIGGNFDWMLARKGSTLTYDTLVPDLLVFPEACSFTIVVKYTDCYGQSQIQYTKTGMLEVDWEVGKKYTYTFTLSLDAITFAEPTVEPWPGTSVKMDDDIEM